ncbi:BMP family lipoprotein [Aeromicrobium wangtongii]|uniref:BMP family ABC transporter substrate-binding protein n=1 Tax=Aeromicrobium wangtongii TaxID=2969247 RepID=A0ABY5M7V1_9ACTN|nr:BMP family ABC transporter substrate-binding protein [Aeromicrobium wangtongii]MCD9198917.1 BMP family ABC transporter substrate-binding protein [Aeromicrobium wangtongii]UUP13045.1 BMP family ABC transporter substrate-binding protein [Aeromicrobium wangtongii]
MTKLSAVAAVAAIALAGCGGSDSEGGSGKDKKAASDDVCKTADGDGPKIGLAYDVGGRGDRSFNDSAYAGVEKAVADFDATCIEGEATDDEAESAREDRLRNMAENGATAIIGVGFAYSESVNAVAPDFPEVNFAVVDGFDPDDKANDNVAYLGFAEEQGSFLVGVAAATKSKSGTIGFVGGVNNDLIQKFEAGYTAGAKAAKPDIKVEVAYIQESDLSGFGDPAGGKAAATGEFDKGADVVYHAAGGSGSGVFDAAVEAGEGNWAIGVDSDQYLTATAAQKPFILTSMLKRVDTASYDFVKSVNDGKPLTSFQVYDLKADGVGYSTANPEIKDLQADIDGYKAKIVDGEIKDIPTKP